MDWSTREVAELAGTTLKTVRHYHAIGLLPEPERAPNGYKRYQISHLVRLLQIRRLVDLGVRLADIQDTEQHMDRALSELDDELAASIERQQRVRAEIAALRAHQESPNLPAGFEEVATGLTTSDRALLLIYSRVFSAADMTSLRDLLATTPRTQALDDFDALPADATEAEREELAGRYAADFRAHFEAHPWQQPSGIQISIDTVQAIHLIAEALAEFYNPAQLDVLARVHHRHAGD